MPVVWIIDDNRQDAAHAKALLEAFFVNHGISCSIRHYLLPPDDTEQMADLVFMDIELEEKSGLNLAAALKKRNPHTQIVLLSSFARYSIKGYQSGASRFLTKPLDLQQLEENLDPDFLRTVALNTSIYDPELAPRPIALSNILFIESVDRSTHLHMSNGHELVSSWTLRQWAEKLNGQDFVQCYKSIFVNAAHIQKMNGTERLLLLSDGQNIPYSRHFRKDVERKRAEILCSNL